MRRKIYLLPVLIGILVLSIIFSWGIQLRYGAVQPQPVLITTGASREIPGPLTWALFISPYGSHDTIIATLQEAKYAIQIWWYQISDEELIAVLRNKAQQGVWVHIILENNVYNNEQNDYQKFIKQITGAWIQVIDDTGLGTNFMHAKTIVIDETTYIVSTANSTYPGFFANREYRFVGKQDIYAQILSDLFTADRKSAPPPALPTNLWICPYNCRTQLTEFLRQATTSIDIQAQYLEDPSVIELLIEKISQGITVRLIFGKYQEDILPDLVQQHTRIQSDPNVHAKNILIDGTQLYIWSMNLSTNAIEQNREIGVVTTDTYVIQKFTTQFAEDRATKAKVQ